MSSGAILYTRSLSLYRDVHLFIYITIHKLLLIDLLLKMSILSQSMLLVLTDIYYLTISIY